MRGALRKIEPVPLAHYNGAMTTDATAMKTHRSIVLALAGAMAALATPAAGATVTNQNGEPGTLIVTEDGVKTELVVAAGETLTFCLTGCFIVLPNGDRAALAGPESVELVGDGAIINR